MSETTRISPDAIRVLKLDGDEVPALDVVFGESLLVVLYQDASLRVWDLATADVTQTIQPPANTPAVTASAGIVASGEATGNWQRRQIADRMLPRAQFSHKSGVSSVIVSQAVSVTVTAGFDGNARAWDVETEEELYTILSAPSALQWLDITADGLQLLVASTGGIIRILTLDVDDLADIARSKVIRGLTEYECTRYFNTDGCEASG